MSDRQDDAMTALVDRLQQPRTMSQYLNSAHLYADLDKDRADAAAAIAALQRDLETFRDFADLWYFVMDEVPQEFQRVVQEYSPSRWLQQAARLRGGAA